MIQIRLIIFLLTISIGTAFPSVITDKYKFNRIDAEKGLSNSEIRSIYKDRSGFIWVGTPSGLNRYDGYEIRSIKQDLSATETPANNDIGQIQEDMLGRLWLTTRTGYAIYNTEQERFEEDLTGIFKQYADTDDFWSVHIDKAKNFWFVTWEDIRFYDVKANQLKVFEQGKGGLSRGLMADIKQGKNRYWFLLDNGQLECMDAQSHKIISRDSTIQRISHVRNGREMRLFVDSAGDVWVYGFDSQLGAAHYNTAKGSWQIYSNHSPQKEYRISNNTVTAIEEDDQKNIWIGTDHGGVNLINKKTGEITVILNDEKDPLSIPQNTIKSIYKDDTGIMWLGTYKKGICYYHESIYKFKSPTASARLPFNDINCFHETADGNIWIGTNGGGLIYFDRKIERYTQYKHDPSNTNSPAGNVVVSIKEDKQGRIWIGYYLEGLDCYDGKKFKNYRYDPDDPTSITDNNVWVLCCDRAGNLWAGTLGGGVVVLDIMTGKIIKHFDTSGSVYSLVESKSGGMFVGAQSGLYIYNPATEKLELYEPEIFSKVQLSRNDINNLYEDTRGLLWIGTRNGLFIYNPYTKEVSFYSQQNGLSSDLVQSIQEDSENNMWIATNRGLTCLKVSTNEETPGYFFQLINYDSSEGLLGEQFNYNASFMTSKSELLFGGTQGFSMFIPTQITYNSIPPKVIITNFQIYNKSIKPNEKYNGRVLLEKSIGLTDKIKLKYSDNYFTLTFAALDYCIPNKARYFYKLEGFNDQWLEADRSSRRVTYTNLNPGTYLFKLKAFNNDGIESSEPVLLKIIITPPFWNTTIAWVIYALLLIAIILWYRRRMTIKAEKKLEYAQEKLKVNQQLEMDEMKLRFFTNISHEFRTPLTLILTPLEELQKKETDHEKKNLLHVIDRNARKLLGLVNQLLDFRKLDVNAHKIQRSHGDIVQFMKEQASLFNEAMNKKQISFTFKSDFPVLYMWFDSDKMGKTMINILSNAYKFTPEGGHVNVKLQAYEREKIKIAVEDDGIGIPESDLDKIFERFYQVKSSKEGNFQGSGIGLHIAKEFIELHGGEIQAIRLPEKGTRFEIILPIVQQDQPIEESEELDKAKEAEETTDPYNSEQSMEDQLPKLLIVEDNADLRSFLSDQFKHEYSVLQAENGVEGKEIALSEIPDMILTDVMMPQMDGVTLCQELKADIRTSHIPLILLTAKSGEESKLEGLTAGADDYITKPFNLDILKIKIKNIVEARKKSQNEFHQQIKIEPSKITVSSLDEKLISKALEYTEKHLSDPDYSVEELSRELGMSRVHLYKKLSSLTGKTPIEFIRVVRLKRAAQLLKESQLSVSEIAYEVGFNNPKYFRKYFKDEFGVLPSQYENRNNE